MRASLVLTMVMALQGVSNAAVACAPARDLEQRLTREQWHDTGLDTLSPAQLALLNRLLHEETCAPASSTPADASDPAMSNDAPVARELRAANPPPAAGYVPGPEYDGKPITSRLRGSVDGWEPGTIFVLENGQRWQVVKGAMKLPKTYTATEVMVVGGFAGRWFLQVDENYPKARVVLLP